MARSHARVHVAIWRNSGWLDLSPKAKLTYLTLLSQPRLNLIGAIDLAERRWAGLIGMTDDHLADALAELERGRFVVIDRATDELLIRTFVAHDLDPGRVNKNLAAGLWGAWGMLASPLLRSVAVHEMPEDHWSKLETHAPRDAAETRRSARLEPDIPDSDDSGCDRDADSGRNLLSPPTTHHPTTPTGIRPIGHDPRGTPPLAQYRPVTEVISWEPPDHDEALERIAAIREETGRTKTA